MKHKADCECPLSDIISASDSSDSQKERHLSRSAIQKDNKKQYLIFINEKETLAKYTIKMYTYAITSFGERGHRCDNVRK